MNRFLIVILFLISSFLLCNSTVKHNDEAKYKRICTLVSKKISIVSLDIKGKEYNFLITPEIDVCIIDTNTCIQNKLKILDSDTPHKVVTLGGISVKDKEVQLMNYSFYVQDLTLLIDDLKNHTGVTIDGLIGSNMLLDENAIINFQKELNYNKN